MSLCNLVAQEMDVGEDGVDVLLLLCLPHRKLTPHLAILGKVEMIMQARDRTSGLVSSNRIIVSPPNPKPCPSS